MAEFALSAGGCSSAPGPSARRRAGCEQWEKWIRVPVQDKVLLGAVCSAGG